LKPPLFPTIFSEHKIAKNNKSNIRITRTIHEQRKKEEFERNIQLVLKKYENNITKF